MAPKWFPSSDDGDVLTRLEPMTASTPISPRKAKKSSMNSASNSRLSATFTESRPWNLMTSARSSDRSSSSSRKRHSFFGSRSSGSSFGTASADPTFSSLSSQHSPQEASFASIDLSTESCSSAYQSEYHDERPRPETARSNDSRMTSISKLQHRRSALFSRTRSANSSKTASVAVEPFSRLLRGDSKASSSAIEPFNRLLRGDSRLSNMATSAIESNEDETDRTFYRKWKKKSISPPFNFQHVTHTQQHQLPALKTVTDGELVSEFWAASAYQAPKHELVGIKADVIETNVSRSNQQDLTSSFDAETDYFTFTHGPLAGMSSSLSVNKMLGGSSISDVDAISPAKQIPAHPSPDTSSASFAFHSLSSRERLNSMSAEPREPPAMIHPALRGQSEASSEDKPLPPTPMYEVPTVSLESVPEELEDTSVSPAKSARARARLNLSPTISPTSSPHPSLPLASSMQHEKGFAFASFPMGNAFAQAYGGDGVQVSMQSDNRLSFGGENSVPSLASGESWENDIDFCYLVEAESTCDFDWHSLNGSRKGSRSGESHCDSTPNMSIRGVSMHEDSLIRPSSQRSSANAPSEDGALADYDSRLPLDKEQAGFVQPGSITSASFTAQHVKAPYPLARTLSSDSAFCRNLSPIIESPARILAANAHHTSLAVVYPSKPVHTRSISDDCKRTANALSNSPARWSIATPSCLPEDIRNLRPSFTSNTKTIGTGQMLFGAPVLPPPRKELPPIPKQQPLTPPVSPPTFSSPEFTALRRPSSPQDRAILQAAGRIVQRGRNSATRPAIQSRLSHVQSMPEPSTRNVMEAPATPTKTGPVQFKLALFPTPPTSPPQQYEEFPAWI